MIRKLQVPERFQEKCSRFSGSKARQIKSAVHVLFGRALYATAAGLVLSGAAQAAGSGMPWEGPLQSVLDSIEGPVARIVAVIIIIITGLTLAFGETSGGFRRLIQIVFGLSIAFAATSFFLAFFSYSGGATL
jgi:type IV secretion system protein VirB2